MSDAGPWQGKTRRLSSSSVGLEKAMGNVDLNGAAVTEAPASSGVLGDVVVEEEKEDQVKVVENGTAVVPAV